MRTAISPKIRFSWTQTDAKNTVAASMIKFRKTILGLLLGFFGLWVLASAWIHQSYFSSLPKVPDEKTDRIYQMAVHGSIRYGSAMELHTLKTVDNFRPIAVCLFLLAVVLGMSWGFFKIAKGRKLNE